LSASPPTGGRAAIRRLARKRSARRDADAASHRCFHRGGLRRYPFRHRSAKIRGVPSDSVLAGGSHVNLDGQLQQIIDELLAHGISLDLAKKEFEKKYIVGAVKRSSGNLGRAACSLGIHRNTLRNKVGILNIRLPREKRRVSPDIVKKK
jgi:transcriptional regulator with GAF, ATPase, and Fis domain